MEKQNMKKKITNYEAPQLTVVEFRMEKGFAVSGPFSQTVNMVNFYSSTLAEEAQQLAGDNGMVGGVMGEGQTTEDHSNPYGGSGWTFENGSYF